MLGGPQSRSGRSGEVKILYPTETRTPTLEVVQPLASRYTDWNYRGFNIKTLWSRNAELFMLMQEPRKHAAVKGLRNNASVTKASQQRCIRIMRYIAPKF
jgi:hypothetical protein